MTTIGLERSLTSPRQARRFVRDTLAHSGLADLAEPAMLLVSELVTNSVVHAGSAVKLTVRVSEGTATVEVADSSPFPPLARDPGSGDASGRGLIVVEATASRWGVRLEQPPGGKTVWFEVTRPDAG